jgi:hypothetical protein
MDITVQQTPITFDGKPSQVIPRTPTREPRSGVLAILPMEILQHIFSYTSNVVFRPFTDEITNKQKWRMWIVSPITKNDPRYRTLWTIPPRLKIYHSVIQYNNPNEEMLNWWYYSVIFRDVPNNKQFNITCKQDSNIDATYIIWKCYEKVTIKQQYQMTDIRMYHIR